MVSRLAFVLMSTSTYVKGVLICVAGLGLLVASDQITDKDWTALSRAKGDGFMIAGATLYGFSMFFSNLNVLYSCPL